MGAPKRHSQNPRIAEAGHGLVFGLARAHAPPFQLEAGILERTAHFHQDFACFVGRKMQVAFKCL
jgi:hypothetical protein